jgi:hypothetical protein
VRVKWLPAQQPDIVNAAAKQMDKEKGGRMGEFHTAMRWSMNSSQKQAIIKNYFSK